MSQELFGLNDVNNMESVESIEDFDDVNINNSCNNSSNNGINKDNIKDNDINSSDNSENNNDDIVNNTNTNEEHWNETIDNNNSDNNISNKYNNNNEEEEERWDVDPMTPHFTTLYSDYPRPGYYPFLYYMPTLIELRNREYGFRQPGLFCNLIGTGIPEPKDPKVEFNFDMADSDADEDDFEPGF
ncbi:hypothetical protein HELRODRAFT_180390 [Helobdella robusta]|uniref:Uncharacterized protein n=1 Tax=Helobdella robusta TaxID=6412 RepID=T1FFV5_HELRO|nr:hypothetical protein HELRODRAFT_180390 [Helobdella robusta]ESN93975.1 hypothetical protein HELRODRAFT_180390 [Helobdella robusta]